MGAALAVTVAGLVFGGMFLILVSAMVAMAKMRERVQWLEHLLHENGISIPAPLGKRATREDIR